MSIVGLANGEDGVAGGCGPLSVGTSNAGGSGAGGCCWMDGSSGMLHSDQLGIVKSKQKPEYRDAGQAYEE